MHHVAKIGLHLTFLEVYNLEALPDEDLLALYARLALDFAPIVTLNFP